MKARTYEKELEMLCSCKSSEAEIAFQARYSVRGAQKSIYCAVNARDITIAVMMAKRIHLYPFRTQKLSSLTPKVLAENCREDR